jgi:F-type H+-transporting ATPase subunit alpha
MADAEKAVREAAADIPDGVTARFDSADKLSDEDRKNIIAIAREALERFIPEPDEIGLEAGSKAALTEKE